MNCCSWHFGTERQHETAESIGPMGESFVSAGSKQNANFFFLVCSGAVLEADPKAVLRTLASALSLASPHSDLHKVGGVFFSV